VSDSELAVGNGRIAIPVARETGDASSASISIFALNHASQR
jgi:hypothetical protein